MTTGKNCYSLNPAVRFFPFDGSDKVLCQLQQSDGRLIASYTLTPELQQLLLRFDGQSEISQISASQSLYAAEKIKQLVDDFLLPQQILLDNCHPTANRTAEKPAYLLFQITLFNPKLTRLLSGWLGVLFHPVVAWPAALLVVLTFCYVNLTLLVQPTQLPTEPTSAIAAVHTVLLLFLALLWHELGHAAAAVRYGCDQTRIGVGGYMCFLIFYADLSQSWRLDGRQRLIVDVAGSYLQGLIAALYLLCYFIWAYPPYLAAFTLLNLYTLYNLNPFFRMDGYWIASDLLAIPNLRERSNQLLREFLTHPWQSYRRYRRGYQQTPLAIYTLFSMAFFICFTYVVIFSLTPATLSRLALILPGLVSNEMSAQPVELLVNYTGLLWHGMMAVFLLLFYLMLFRSLLRFFRWRPVSAVGEQETPGYK